MVMAIKGFGVTVKPTPSTHTLGIIVYRSAAGARRFIR
jgi:hypothetical protein